MQTSLRLPRRHPPPKRRSRGLPYASLPRRTSSPRLTSPPSLNTIPQHIPCRLTPMCLGKKPSTTAPINSPPSANSGKIAAVSLNHVTRSPAAGYIQRAREAQSSLGLAVVGLGNIANEPLGAAKVWPEESEALKNWQSQSQMQGRAQAEEIRR